MAQVHEVGIGLGSPYLSGKMAGGSELFPPTLRSFTASQQPVLPVSIALDEVSGRRKAPYVECPESIGEVLEKAAKAVDGRYSSLRGDEGDPLRYSIEYRGGAVDIFGDGSVHVRGTNLILSDARVEVLPTGFEAKGIALDGLPTTLTVTRDGRRTFLARHEAVLRGTPPQITP